MKNFFVALLLLLNFGVFADAWLPTASPVPVGTSTGVNNNINMVYDAANQTIVAAWGDDNNPNIPFYAVYNGTAWVTAGTPIPLGASTGVTTDINLTYDAAHQTVVAVWADSSTLLPYYAVFDGLSWIVPGTPIPLGTSTGVVNTFGLSNVTVTYDAANQTVFAAWTDQTNIPYYAVFNGSIWITAGTPIPLGASSSSRYDIALTYDAANQTVIAAWSDNFIYLPYYAVFDGSAWITPGTLFPFGTSIGVNYNISLVYDAANQTVIAAWADKFNPFVPYYSVFNGSSWTIPATIPTGTSAGVFQDVTLSFNAVSNTVFAAWKNSVSDLPYYSIFNGASWTTADQIPSAPTTGTWNNVGLAFHTATRQMVAAWRQGFEFPIVANPFYNIYLTSFPVPLPPETLSESSCCARFATQKVTVTTLTWLPSPTVGVTAYNIYRNGIFIAQVGASTLEYKVSGNCSGGDVYGVTSLSIGGESPAITVTVPANRNCR